MCVGNVVAAVALLLSLPYLLLHLFRDEVKRVIPSLLEQIFLLIKLLLKRNSHVVVYRRWGCSGGSWSVKGFCRREHRGVNLHSLNLVVELVHLLKRVGKLGGGSVRGFS